MRRAFPKLLSFLLLLPTPLRGAGGPASLPERLAAAARPAGGTVGVHAVHLPSGRELSLNEDEPFPMASVYKVPIALAVLDRVDRGEVALDEALPVSRDDLRRGLGEALTARFVEGMTVTVAEALERMVAGSENTPTDLLLRRIGGPAAVQARLSALGVSGLRVDRAELALFADGSGIAGLPADGRCSPGCVEALLAKVPAASREAALRRFQSDPRDTASPRALARLLVRLAGGELLSSPSTARLLGWMRGCLTGDQRLRARLPEGVVVMNETGTQWMGANDAAIVQLPQGRGTVVVAILVKASPRPIADQEAAIASIGKLVVEELPRAEGKGK